MGRAKELSAADVRVIQELCAQGVKMKTIAARVGCSVASVSRVSSGARGERAKSRSGRPKKITERLVRQIVRAVSIGNESAAQAQASVNAPVSVRTVQRTLQEHPDMKWKKMKHGTMMNAAHMKKRLAWTTEKAAWGIEEWSKVVFSDEKKWNLDGPDGMKSYWHNSKLPERVVVKRHSGGGSVMVWGAFSSAGKTELKFVDGNQDSAHYVETLGSHLLPFLREKHVQGHIFQHDNAPSHRARNTQEWLEANNVTTMTWPAMSPDLNPIEHLWGILTRSVYANGRQYESKVALKAAILKVWNGLDPEVLQTLLHSMPKRCAEVTKRRGAFITTT